jgi:hypothetical protein
MTGDNTDKELVDKIASEDSTEENVVLDPGDDAFADSVIAANVDALVARIDATDVDEAARQREARKRLEELGEQKSKELDDTFNFNLDDDL